MKIVKFLFILLFPSLLYSATENRPSDTILFTGGLNVKDSPVMIDPSQSPDMVNFISDNKSATTRNGTKRFNTTVLSTNPITGLYKAYGLDGRQLFICTSFGKIFVSTINTVPTEDVFYSSKNVFLSTYTGLSPPNDRFQFSTFNNKVIMTNGSTVPLKLDLAVGTVSFLTQNAPIAKFNLVYRDYLLLARTTDQPLRLFYSEIRDESNFPTNNTIDLQFFNGSKITGMTSHDGVNIYTNNAVWKLSFTMLDPDLTIGDQIVSPLFNGFGCIAPYSLVSFGDGDFFLAQDGIRLTIGGASQIISTPIEPIINNLINSQKYESATSFYDTKNKWIWFSYEDSKKYPKNVNNSILIFDLKTAQWFPIDGIYANCFCQWDGVGDNGEMFAGQSNDGYILRIDDDSEQNDPKNELPLIGFEGTEQTFTSVQPSISNTAVIEGTCSIKKQAFEAYTDCIIVPNTISIFSNGEKVESTDKLSFKFMSAGHPQINVKLTFTGGNLEYTFFTTNTYLIVSTWAVFNVMLKDYTTISAGTVNSLLRNTLTSISFRWNSTSSENNDFFIDDVRIVKSSSAIINSYRMTKPLDLNLVNDKTWAKCYTNLRNTNNTKLKVDVIDDLGENIISQTVDPEYKKYLYVTSANVISKIDYNTLTVARTSNCVGNNIDILKITPNYLYAYGLSSRTLFQLNPDSMTVNWQVSSFGNGDTFGTNFPESEFSPSMAESKGFLYFLDSFKNRIIKFKTNGVFSSSISLVDVSTPSSIATDGNVFYVFDVGGKKIIKYDFNFGKINDIFVNSVGVGKVEVSPDYLVSMYRRNPEYPYVSASSGVVIQLRDKNSLLIKKEIFLDNASSDTYPLNCEFVNDYLLAGSSFTNATTSSYLIFYNLKNLDIVRQTNKLGSLRGFSIASYYVPEKRKIIPLGTSGRYMQLKYIIDEPNSKASLFDNTFIYTPQELK